MVDLRINETLQTGAVRRPHLPFCRLVGTVSNSADAVRLETAPTGGESVYLFLEFTIITERDFYLKSQGVLKRLGYYTKGHVVAKNVETDLAIIRLDGLPETARQIDWGFTTPTINGGELVYLLGNPGGRDLWHWKLGQFQNDYGKVLHIQSDVFGGNSGGTMQNKQGILLGIIARSDRHMNALAIPARYIHQLLSESNVKHSGSRR